MQSLFSLNAFFWKYRYRLFLGCLFVIGTNYFRILSPQITGYAVNEVVGVFEHSTPSINTSSDFLVRKIVEQFQTISLSEKIFWCGIVLLLVAVISGFFMFLMRQTIIVMSRLIEYDQKNEIYNHYQKLDLSFYKSHRTGDLMSRISEDVSRVRMFTGPAIMYFINLAAILGFSIFFMFKANVKLTWVALSPLPILAITIYFVNTLIHKKSERLQSLISDLTTNAQETFSGIRVIKSFVQEKAMLRFFSSNSELYKDQALDLAKTEAIYFPSMSLMIGVSTLVTIMIGALDVIHHVPGASVGTIAEFVLYIQMLTFPVSAIGWTASMTQRAAASQKRINEFLDIQPAIKGKDIIASADFPGQIKFKDVSFTYGNTGIEAIKNFNLEIKKGEKIAIIGKTGSGKTTIAQLLLHMFEPNSGEIVVDEVPLNNYDLQSLRSNISYVPQDAFLFSDSISSNIAFGMELKDESLVVKSAKEACIHEEIMQFPEGYQTMVGERGVTLSGGQKQRVSIARALMRHPSLVIFDDCLSAVDASTERTILNNLNVYLRNKTAIIITHRMLNLFDFDQIVVLENGSIKEIGDHSTLLALGGYYASLYKKQTQAMEA